MTTLVNSGSFYEGTKVGQPHEFDYFIQLDAFSLSEDVMFEELPCSTVFVGPSESVCLRYKLLFADQDLPWPDFRAFEWKKNIKTPFFKLFNSKAQGFEAFGMKVGLWREADDVLGAPRPLSKHGPAYTLLLEWKGGERYKGLRISVDLALAVKINSRPLKVDLKFESASGQVVKSLLDGLPYFLAVGSYRNALTEVHPNFFAECEQQNPGFRPINFCLRCSQSCLEQALFRQEFGPESGQSKCLRLLKVLRDILFPDKEIRTRKLVSSYVLKTLVLFEWKQNPKDESWTGSNLRQRLLNILRNLVGHLNERKLTSFFYADYNLFHTTTLEIDFFNAASIINILLNRLDSIDNLPQYKFEDCLEKLVHDSKMIYRKKKFTSALIMQLSLECFSNVYFQEVVEKSLRDQGKGDIYDSHESVNKNPIEGARKMMEEFPEKHDFFDIYIQSLLDEIAPEETLILTSVKAKKRESLSSAVKHFESIARRRMAKGDNLPSYNLWTDENWTIEELQRYSFLSDGPKELLQLTQYLSQIFLENIMTLRDELMGC